MKAAFVLFLSLALAVPLAFASPRIELTLSVDWEGDDLQEENTLAAQTTEEKPLRLHFGFHQETAALYLGRVRAALDKIRAYSDQNGLSWAPAKLRSDAFYAP